MVYFKFVTSEKRITMWIINFLKSSVGRKLVMSLTGLFLCLFLAVHLFGNFQLMYNDGGEAFNTYTYIMTHTLLIKLISYGNYFFILLHAFQGILIALSNRSAKGTKYAVSSNASASWASKNMALLGTLVLAFICIHMGDFWFKMKMDHLSREEGVTWLNMVDSATLGHEVLDLYEKVQLSFSKLWIVIVYLIGLLALAFHLNHGFASAFQTLGINHKKYTPFIKLFGKAFSILIPLGFAVIALKIYISQL